MTMTAKQQTEAAKRAWEAAVRDYVSNICDETHAAELAAWRHLENCRFYHDERHIPDAQHPDFNEIPF